jgi:hypothetical protein
VPRIAAAGGGWRRLAAAQVGSVTTDGEAVAAPGEQCKLSGLDRALQGQGPGTSGPNKLFCSACDGARVEAVMHPLGLTGIAMQSLSRRPSSISRPS